MAKKRQQYLISIIRLEECQWTKKNELVFNAQNFDLTMYRSVKITVSEARFLRQFSKTTIDWEIVAKDEHGNMLLDENGKTYKVVQPIRNAKEFVVIDMSKCEDISMIAHALHRGVVVVDKSAGTKERFQRCAGSPSQIRTSKRLFTSLNVDEVRKQMTYGMRAGAKEVIAKVEARYGIATSSTIEIEDLPVTFDVLPDYEYHKAKYDVEMYDIEKGEMFTVYGYRPKKAVTPLDGQGTMLPSYAVKVTHKLAIISRHNMEYLLFHLEASEEDVHPWILPSSPNYNPKFARLWKKIPSGFQTRYLETKGFLKVWNHKKEKTDWQGKTYRDSGKIMDYWKAMYGEGYESHAYNFNADILFTDSMWKMNVDPELAKDAPLEIVLWQKNKASNKTFMGHQYWQALRGIDVYQFAKKAQDEVKETIFENAEDALLFLGIYDNAEMSDEDYEGQMTSSGTKIQKIVEILSAHPHMIKEQWIQQGIRQIRERFFEQMAKGRIPVEGYNPYIITSPEVMFGHKPFLKKGQNYFNGIKHTWAGFRSPLIHYSEAVVLKTVDVPEYYGLCEGILVLNPFDDTLPRMGGADTDGDKIALIADPEIVKYVAVGVPMLFDEGGHADEEKMEMTKRNIAKYDYATIVNDAPSIGEITNWALTWKDLLDNQAKLKKMKFSVETVEKYIKILRFMQGWAIDYAKTGWFPEFAELSKIKINKSPDWKDWSKNARNTEVYVSQSQLGMLFRAINEEMKTFRTEFKYRDFYFEMTDKIDKLEAKRIRPLIVAIESNYRKDLDRMGDMKLDKDDQREYMQHIFEKYTRIMKSIDADIRTIAGVAYEVAYTNKSKRKSISFPWIVCYEGLIMNASASSDAHLRLRKVDFDGHIDDIPATVQIKDGECNRRHYSIEVEVPNGKYETVKRHGSLFIKLKKVDALSKAIAEDIARPENKSVGFTLVGFKENDTNAVEVKEMILANGGQVTVARVYDKDEYRLGVFINGERVCSLSKDDKPTLADIVTADTTALFTIVDADQLKDSYIAKKGEFAGKKKIATGMSCEAHYAGDGGEVHYEPASETADEYIPMDEDYTYGYDEYALPTEEMVYEMDIDLEEEAPVVSFDTHIMDQIKAKSDAFYLDMEIDPASVNITNVTVKQVGAIKMNQRCAEVTLTNQKGNKLIVSVKAVAGRQFDVDMDRKLKADLKALVLKVAHYELYALHLAKREA